MGSLGNRRLEAAGTFPVDGRVANASVEGYDALLLPGGTVNPDKLRLDKARLHSSETSWAPASRLQPFAIARGRWWRPALCADGNLLTSRSPDDLPRSARRSLKRLRDLIKPPAHWGAIADRVSNILRP